MASSQGPRSSNERKHSVELLTRARRPIWKSDVIVVFGLVRFCYGVKTQESFDSGFGRSRIVHHHPKSPPFAVLLSLGHKDP